MRGFPTAIPKSFEGVGGMGGSGRVLVRSHWLVRWRMNGRVGECAGMRPEIFNERLREAAIPGETKRCCTLRGHVIELLCPDL